MAQPSAAVVGCRQLAFIVDEIWHAAGDTSTDTSWYTKRALLAGVYSATELYMLTDYSPEYADTWESLDRRLTDVMRLGSAAREVSDLRRHLWSQCLQLHVEFQTHTSCMASIRSGPCANQPAALPHPPCSQGMLCLAHHRFHDLCGWQSRSYGRLEMPM